MLWFQIQMDGLFGLGLACLILVGREVYWDLTKVLRWSYVFGNLYFQSSARVLENKK